MKQQERTRNLLEPKELARYAHLRYVSDDSPGYSRRRNGSGFHYLNLRGSSLRDADIVERIKELVIPPAWEKVWICRYENGHLQSTGYDARERKQYLYHAKWQEAANQYKFDRLSDFGKALSSIRRKLAVRVQGKELTRTRVLAAVLAILDATSIRVGNEEYVKANNSFGLTTLRNRHLSFEGRHAILKFRGKSGVQQELVVKSKAAVRVLKQCSKLSGTHVFQYKDDDGSQHVVTSTDVNDFLEELTGDAFTAKDFRTWAASSLVAGILFDADNEDSLAARKRTVRAAVKSAAEILGNTVATAKKYYIHPRLLESYDVGKFAGLMARFSPNNKRGFSRDEQLLAHFLRRCGSKT